MDAQAMLVGEVAVLLGVSVRTLHHWDAIGLVRPSERSRVGYRLYSLTDRQRLQQVMLYRETGMPLALIGQLLDDPGADALACLSRQRELLLERISRLTRMVRVVTTMMEKMAIRQPLTPVELAGLWKTDWDPAYAEEAEQAWGGTEDWDEAARRQAAMTRADWIRAHDAVEVLEADLAEAMCRGVVPGSPEADVLAERHRAELNRWFTVSVSKQVLIARGYGTSGRYQQHYDRRAPGLAAWLKDVVDASARRQGVDPETARWC